MGCDIHAFAEVRRNGVWEKVGDIFPLSEYAYRKKKGITHGDEPFNARNYGMFGFLADVRNYSRVTPLDAPRGLPSDISPEVASLRREWGEDGHSTSWFTVSELIAVNYDEVFWDRRITRQEGPNFFNGAALANEGEGTHLPLKDFLPVVFFRDLDILKGLGAPEGVRVVFWFDN